MQISCEQNQGKTYVFPNVTVKHNFPNVSFIRDFFTGQVDIDRTR